MCMPLPMVHFAVADSLVRTMGIEDEGAFYLGSIAPDSVHMRTAYTREDKDRSHLRIDRVLWKETVLAWIRTQQKAPQRDFRLGYGIHILTDYFWKERVYLSYAQRYRQDPDPAEDIRAAYYTDADQLDFVLYKIWPRCAAVWDALYAASAAGIEGLVSAWEVEAWKQRTLSWFDEGKSLHATPARYLRFEEITDFVQASSAWIADVLELPAG